MVSSLIHSLSVDYLDNLKNLNIWFLISKDDASDHPSVKLELMMFYQRGYMSTSKRPFWGLRLILRHFRCFVKVFTSFLQSFGVMGQRSKNELLYGAVHAYNR